MNHANDNTNHANQNERFLISLTKVCEMTSLSRTAINKFRFRGQFPEAVNMGERRVAFVYGEVVEWINARVEAREHSGRKFKLPPLKQERQAA